MRAVKVLIALTRGTLHALRYRLTSGRVRIGMPFLVYGPVHISGPGTVRIGKGCCVQRNVHEGLNIVTFSADALVEIGERCLLGGLNVRARRGVSIGARTMTAHCLVQDDFFFSRPPSETEVLAGAATQPVFVGDNVWLGLFSTVLNGARIGRNSVLSSHALCFAAEVDDDSVANGNPMRRPIRVQSLLRAANRT
jgi:acetyltransferase-like isoleucine patch superfamily enzyme